MAASAGVMRLVLEALRRHASSEALAAVGWTLVSSLCLNNRGQTARAVEAGAVDLALAAVGGTDCPDVAAKLLHGLRLLAELPYQARATALKSVMVRILVLVTRRLLC